MDVMLLSQTASDDRLQASYRMPHCWLEDVEINRTDQYTTNCHYLQDAMLDSQAISQLRYRSITSLHPPTTVKQHVMNSAAPMANTICCLFF